jgi:outer membrane protein OmpA-like peptidoglycan-associated protein
MYPIFKTTLCGALAVALTACAENPYPRTTVGAGVGAAAGAGIGYAINKGTGALIGGAVGALAGGAVGNYMDRQQQALQQALAEEQRRKNVRIVRQQDNSIRLDIPSEVSFDFDSAAIKPAFVPSLTKVANVLKEYPNTQVIVVGYTDNIGSEVYNLGLSQRRAQSVADFLSQQGVAPQRLMTEGRGMQNPRADNSTEAGRRQNRRVEIFIRPIVEGQGQPTAGQPGGGYGAPQGNYPPPAQQGGYGAPGGYPPPPAQQGGYPPPPVQQGGYGAPNPGGYGSPPQPGQGGYYPPSTPPQSGGSSYGYPQSGG